MEKFYHYGETIFLSKKQFENLDEEDRKNGALYIIKDEKKKKVKEGIDFSSMSIEDVRNELFETSDNDKTLDELRGEVQKLADVCITALNEMNNKKEDVTEISLEEAVKIAYGDNEEFGKIPTCMNIYTMKYSNDSFLNCKSSKPIIYAFHINDKESDPFKAVTYLEDAEGLTPAHMDYETDTFNYGSWENSFFMPRPCMLKYDGTVDYYLDNDDYTKKEDGTDSDIENPSYEGNAMMEWGRDGKQIWVKVDTTSDGCSSTSPTIYISDTQVDDTYKAYSFINNQGALVEHFYTPIYNGSNISNRLRSISGQTCSVSTTAETEITYAKANNIGNDVLWYTETFVDRCLINYLLILMGRSLDTQTVFGKGNVDDHRSLSTGTMNNKGLFWGESTGKYGVKVFGMENWWGNITRRIAGLINVKGTVYSKMTYGTQDGSTVEGYNLTGDGYVNICVFDNWEEHGFISKVTFGDSGMIPSEWNGDERTNYCDYSWIDNYDTNVAIVGGDWYNSLGAGAFYVYLDVAASYSDSCRGASISCKPLS